MATWRAWVIHKRYYKVQVEAGSWEEAKEKVWDLDIDNPDDPDDTDMEIYDIEEIEE
jgi:hypothetical protein